MTFATKPPYWRGRHGGRIHRILGAILSVAILCIALWFLHQELGNLQAGAILAQMRAIPFATLLAAVGCAVGSYLVLTVYDALGMLYIGRKLAYRHTAQTAFMAFAVGHNVGIAALSGGSIRYRMYSLLGLSGFEIAKIIVFVSVTFALGASLLLGIAMLLMPTAETAILKLSPNMLNVTGLLLLAAPLIYLLFAVFGREPITIGKWRLSFPVAGIGFAQIGLSASDLMFAAATLFVLLAPELSIGFFPFLGIFLIAIAAGLISSVPGGIGVFEAVLLMALPGVDRSVLLGTVIVYRLIYYVAPLCLAVLLLVVNEIKQHRHILVSSSEKLGGWLVAIVPGVVGVVVFLAGVVLLISGATPAVESRLTFIARGIPLPVLELSHLTGSVLGVGLLVLAVDLMRHSRMAPNGVMDYLFTELMLWGKTQGYAWFNLGMAPLSGLDQHTLAPLWHKLGHLIFSHGESFYNFEGLRNYKGKFNPQWRPRYIACPEGLLGLPHTLLDASRLISGGVGKLLKK